MQLFDDGVRPTAATGYRFVYKHMSQMKSIIVVVIMVRKLIQNIQKNIFERNAIDVSLWNTGHFVQVSVFNKHKYSKVTSGESVFYVNTLPFSICGCHIVVFRD